MTNQIIHEAMGKCWHATFGAYQDKRRRWHCRCGELLPKNSTAKLNPDYSADANLWVQGSELCEWMERDKKLIDEFLIILARSLPLLDTPLKYAWRMQTSPPALKAEALVKVLEAK